MTKLTLQDIANLQNESTVVTALKSNNDVTEAAMEKTLSRDGTAPNQMLSNLDMNNYKVINLPDAFTAQEPATYSQLTSAITAIGNGAVIDAPYVTLGNNATLLSERVLTAGTYTSLTDSGAGGTIKVDVSDPELVALANTTSAADQVPYFTGAGAATTSTLSSYGRTLIDDADAATARATLGSVIGTNVQAWDTDLDAVAGLATTGLISRTGAGTASTRTITGTANEITSTNGDGVAGNPTVSLPSALTFTGKTVTGGTYNSPALVTPALGTPASGVATNLTGTAAGLTAGNVTTNANLTGPITSVGNTTSIASQTGTGTKFVVDTTPTLVTPVLGVATATSVNKVGITAPTTSATLTIPDGVTLTGPAASGTAMTLGNTETVTGVKTFGSAGAVGRLKLSGTTSGTTVLDASATASGTLTLPAATDTLVGKATTDTLTNKTYDTAGTGNSFSINGVAATANTGTGSVVRATSPTLVTPALGTPTALTLTSATGLPLSGLNTQATYTIVANNTAGSAAPTAVDIPSLTLKAAPVSADIVLIQDSAASNAFKRATVGTLASAGSVSSIAGNTGAFTLSTGITNVANDIRFNPTAAATVNVVKVQKFTASGTYTPSAGIQYAIIECVGGGGGGGGVANTAAGAGSSAGGGGAGSYSRSYVSAASIGASKTVTIGAAGTFGTAAAVGGNGGDTSVGTLCIGKGGTGGSSGPGAPGGDGGVSGTGDVVTSGASGGAGQNQTIITITTRGPGGGSSPFGGGGKETITGGNVQGGNPGTGFGAGGGAGNSQNGAGAANGAVGSAGLVIITEFCNQ